MEFNQKEVGLMCMRGKKTGTRRVTFFRGLFLFVVGVVRGLATSAKALHFCFCTTGHDAIRHIRSKLNHGLHG